MPAEGTQAADAEVTVVIPTKDRPSTLSRTVAAVRAQRGVKTAVVVVDDGSSPALARETRQVAESCLVLRHDSSLGVAAARNAGLAAASTPWVAFVDDDDLWAPDKLRRQLAAAARHRGTQWVCSGAALFTQAGGLLAYQPPPHSGDVLPDLLRGNVIPGGGSGVLARTDLLRRIDGMDTAFSTLADWDCWIRLAVQSPLATVAQPDVGYLVHPSSMAHDIGLADRELVRLVAKHDSLYQALGQRFDDKKWSDYQSTLAYRSGAWLTGVRLSARLVLRHGQASAMLQPAISLLPERARRPVRRRRLRRTLQTLPSGALDWLPCAAALADGADELLRSH